MESNINIYWLNRANNNNDNNNKILKTNNDIKIFNTEKEKHGVYQFNGTNNNNINWHPCTSGYQCHGRKE